jgi:hypothetical protein
VEPPQGMPVAFRETFLFPTPCKWAAAPSLDFNINSTWTQCWRFDSLDAAVKTLCPMYGRRAFVVVRERVQLLGVPYPPPRPFTPGEYNVLVASPVGVLVRATRGFAIGDLVCVITERDNTYGVVKTGLPQITFVSKTRICVVAPVLVEYNANRDQTIRMRFKRSTLDHFGFSIRSSLPF